MGRENNYYKVYSINFTEIVAKTIVETDEAILFDDGDKEFWIPKSLMEDWPDERETGEVIVRSWFAEKEGLI